jgi:hypothetical protein
MSYPRASLNVLMTTPCVWQISCDQTRTQITYLYYSSFSSHPSFFILVINLLWRPTTQRNLLLSRNPSQALLQILPHHITQPRQTLAQSRQAVPQIRIPPQKPSLLTFFTVLQDTLPQTVSHSLPRKLPHSLPYLLPQPPKFHPVFPPTMPRTHPPTLLSIFSVTPTPSNRIFRDIPPSDNKRLCNKCIEKEIYHDTEICTECRQDEWMRDKLRES